MVDLGNWELDGLVRMSGNEQFCGVFCKGVEIIVMSWLGFNKTLKTE